MTLCKSRSGGMASALAVLADKVLAGIITQEEHDAILEAHVLSTRPITEQEDGGGPRVQGSAAAPLNADTTSPLVRTPIALTSHPTAHTPSPLRC